MIGDDRSARLTAAMADAGLDMLLVYGNAWQGDYLRYATDFGIVEGQALALVAYPLALLPIVLAYGGRYAFSSNLAFYVLLGFAAILGGMVYWFAMESAVRTAETNREQILKELSRSDGPLVSES